MNVRELPTRVSGLVGSAMAAASLLGLTVRNSTENGSSAGPSGRDDSIISKERSMRVAGGTTKLTVSVFILIIMALNTRVSGDAIYSMVPALKHGLIPLNSSVNIRKAARMESESIFGQMAPSTRVNGRRTRSRVTVCISGVTAGATSATGRETSWRISAYTPGKTEGDTRGSTGTTRNTGMGCTLGVIRKSTPAGGIMVSSMASAFSCNGKVDRRNTVFGRTVKRSVGFLPKKFKLSNLVKSKILPKSSQKTHS